MTSKRQEWILEMIKGPDIVPVDNCPGHYSTKTPITITGDDGQVIIRPVDVLDLSDPQNLIVHTNTGVALFAWDRISRLDYEEEAASSPRVLEPLRALEQKVLNFSVGKKAV